MREAPGATIGGKDVRFPAGIYGFPELRNGLFLPHGSTHGVRWLQATHHPSLIFLTIEPSLVVSNYEVTLARREAQLIGLTRTSEAAVVTFVRLSAESEAITTNLLAPIVINTTTWSACHVILPDARYAIDYPIRGQLRDRLYASLVGEDSWLVSRGARATRRGSCWPHVQSAPPLFHLDTGLALARLMGGGGRAH